MPRVAFYEDSDSGLGFEIGHRQPKLWRTPNLQFLANLAVCTQ